MSSTAHTSNSETNSDVTSASPPPLWPLPMRYHGSFAQDGNLTFCWDEQGFKIQRSSILLDRTLHTFPLNYFHVAVAPIPSFGL